MTTRDVDIAKALDDFLHAYPEDVFPTPPPEKRAIDAAAAHVMRELAYPWMRLALNEIVRLREQLRLATIDAAINEADANDARLFLALERLDSSKDTATDVAAPPGGMSALETIEDLQNRCVELLRALRDLLDNPMGGYEHREAFMRARSHASAVAARYDDIDTSR